jgi:hypothetical protein
MFAPTDAQLTQMRAQRTASLRDTCVVTPAVADGGTPVPFTVACTVFVPQGGMDGGGTGTLSRRARRSVTFPWGTSIKTGDRFTWFDKTLEVADVTDTKTYSMAVHADCVQVTT